MGCLCSCCKFPEGCFCHGFISCLCCFFRCCVSDCCANYFASYEPGWPDPDEEKGEDVLSDGAKALVTQAFEGIDVEKILDVHVHIIGAGDSGDCGCYVHDNYFEGMTHGLEQTKMRIFTLASGIDVYKDMEDKIASKKYLERLFKLHRNYLPLQQSKLPWLNTLAMDEIYDEKGTLMKERTSLYISNDYVLKIQTENAGVRATGSVHPYRKDAPDELERLYKEGVRCIKWLPNSMLIDPANAACDPFYKKMAELNIWLLCHTGSESSVGGSGYVNQAFGNPLRLRRALDAGVHVIMAHCAMKGMDTDIDSDSPTKGQEFESFEFFMRLMDEEKYKGLAFGGISACIGRIHAQKLPRLLARQDLHERLVYGSDYPVPAVYAVFSHAQLASLNLISENEAELLHEIYRWNPLTHDFVLKRLLRYPADNSSKQVRFKDCVFQCYDKMYEGAELTPTICQPAAVANSSWEMSERETQPDKISIQIA